MGDSEVLLERSGSITRVILNRPERRNALAMARSDDHKRRLAAFRAQRRAKPQ